MIPDNAKPSLKPLSDGAWAMCVLNRNTTPQQFTFDWEREAVEDDFAQRTAYRFRNLWTKQDLGTTEEALSAEVPGHDVLLLRLQKQ